MRRKTKLNRIDRKGKERGDTKGGGRTLETIEENKKEKILFTKAATNSL